MILYDLCLKKDAKCRQELYRMSLIISFTHYCPLYHCLNVPVQPSVIDFMTDEMGDCSETAQHTADSLYDTGRSCGNQW